MADYQQLRDRLTGTISATILRRVDAAHIPPDPANRDRAAFEAWMDAGNRPDPPDPLPDPKPPAPLVLAAHPEQEMDASTKGYVDTEVSALAGGAWPTPFVLASDPTEPMEAVTRRYCDEQVARVLQLFSVRPAQPRGDAPPPSDDPAPFAIFTPRLNLAQPDVGGDIDVWGGLLNDNATILDQAVRVTGDTVTGAILTQRLLPTIDAEFVPKVYVDTVVAGVPAFPEAPPGPPVYGRNAGNWLPVLPLSGGTMTGALNVTATGGNTSRSVQDRAADVANVLDFGADPTGSTDSSPAFNAAASAIVPGGSGYYKSIYVPAGRYRIDHTVNLINGQQLYGDNRANSWIYADGNFNLSSVALFHVLATTQSLDPGPSFRNISITCVQLNSWTTRAQCTQFPPVILVDANAGRIKINDVRIGGAWVGIKIDNGVYDIDGLELGAVSIGLDLGRGAIGAQDFCKLSRIHCWNFDFNYQILTDGGTCAMTLGRADGISINSFQAFDQYITVGGSGSTLSQWSNLMLDGDQASITFTDGLHHQIADCYSSASTSRTNAAVTVNGNTGVLISNWYSHNSSAFPMFDVQAGELSVESAHVRHYVLNAPVGRTSTGNALLRVFNANVWTNAGTYTQPLFLQGGGSSRLVIDSLTVDNLGSSNSGVAVSYSTDTLGNICGKVVLPSGWTVQTAGTTTLTRPTFPAGASFSKDTVTSADAYAVNYHSQGGIYYNSNAPGNQRGFVLQSNAAPIWNIVTVDAETGGNNGGNISFQACADGTGAVTQTPLKLWRSNGLVNCLNLQVDGGLYGSGFSNYLAAPPAIGGTTANAGTFTNLTSNGNLVSTSFSYFVGSTAPQIMVGSNTAATEQRIVLNSAAGQYRDLAFFTNGNWRFYMGVTGTTESGSNAGSDLVFNAFNDAGTVIFTPITITRATGVVTFGGTNGQVNIGSATSPNIRSGTGAATGTQPAGSLWLRTDGTPGALLYVSAGGGVWRTVPDAP